MTRVLICGSTMGGSLRKVRELVAGLEAGSTVIVGDRPGLEQLVRDEVERRDDLHAHVFHPELFPDDAVATEIDRAQRMVREGRPDVVLTFGSGAQVRVIADAADLAGVPVKRAGGRG